MCEIEEMNDMLNEIYLVIGKYVKKETALKTTVSFNNKNGTNVLLVQIPDISSLEITFQKNIEGE